jgi:hypothetical protein
MALRTVCLLSLLLAATTAVASRARITLLGTTVDVNGVQPAPGVRVTLWPAGNTALSDSDGDFLLDWDGSRGWLTLVPPDSMLTGSLWCKRYALSPLEDPEPPPTRDLGLITVSGRARLAYLKVLGRPKDLFRPDSLDLPGPPPGQSDTCHVVVHYEADIWGRVTKAERIDGDTQPKGLVDAIVDWGKHVEWVVPVETSCDGTPPFSSNDEATYVWNGRTWTFLDRVQLRLLEVQRRREANARAAESSPR